MARSKEGKKDEFNLGIIRNLKKQVRTLQKQLRQLQRTQHIFEDQQLIDDDAEIQEAESKSPKLKRCPKCNLQAVQERIVINRLFEECKECSWRGPAKKLND